MVTGQCFFNPVFNHGVRASKPPLFRRIVPEQGDFDELADFEGVPRFVVGIGF